MSPDIYFGPIKSNGSIFILLSMFLVGRSMVMVQYNTR